MAGCAQTASTPTNDDYLVGTDILNKAIKNEPDNFGLYFERSICHYNLNKYQASLEDADVAIEKTQLTANPDPGKLSELHYQKGLALTGLKKYREAVISYKKSIELKATQESSKLFDIFKLLIDAVTELSVARGEKPPSFLKINSSELTQNQMKQGAAKVDSTTDKPFLIQPGTSTNQNHNLYKHHPNIDTSKNLIQVNGNSGLVGQNRNINSNINLNQQIPNTNQIFNAVNFMGTSNRVSSSASHTSSHLTLPSFSISPNISGISPNTQTLAADLLNNQMTVQHTDQSRAAQYEWSIRRSERIFLNHSTDSMPASSYGILPIATMTSQPQRTKSGSNPSSIISGGKGGTKRQHDQIEPQTQPHSKMPKSREGTESHVESDIDVEDTSFNHSSSVDQPPSESAVQSGDLNKRVMIAPSSSMPATPTQSSSTVVANKDNSYSSKYKRARRDRERARRGTSKLCTIKASDLEELQKSTNSDQASKRLLRVIAPIDGWLYSGQLSVDENVANNNSNPQYVVKLDGDSTGSCYLFSAQTVLDDVIKEVRVKSVSDLRKGARICCYWSRQYKCLSTGVVTSRTFEATKSLVSVKYDNGDLSALPLEDLRLLPPDYPKYMSNCDPLLLARNGDGVHATNAITTASGTSTNINANQNISRVILDTNENNSNHKTKDAEDISNLNVVGVTINTQETNNVNLTEKSQTTNDTTEPLPSPKNESVVKNSELHNDEDTHQLGNNDEKHHRIQDAIIPPTDETIDFITSESTLKEQDDNHLLLETSVASQLERAPTVTKDNVTTDLEVQHNNNTNTSRASSEENTYCGMEYRPWMFEGPPKVTRRNGRTYLKNYNSIKRGDEVIRIGDSAELMPKEVGIIPYVAKIDSLWATSRGEMRVRVRWYYRPEETVGEPNDLPDRANALWETEHTDENDIQSIYKAVKILSWTEYKEKHFGHVNNINFVAPKIFYVAGYYNPKREIKHLRTDVKDALRDMDLD